MKIRKIILVIISIIGILNYLYVLISSLLVLFLSFNISLFDSSSSTYQHYLKEASGVGFGAGYISFGVVISILYSIIAIITFIGVLRLRNFARRWLIIIASVGLLYEVVWMFYFMTSDRDISYVMDLGFSFFSIININFLDILSSIFILAYFNTRGVREMFKKTTPKLSN